MLKNKIQKWALDFDWRLLVLIVAPLSLLLYISLTYTNDSFSPLRAFLLQNHPLAPPTTTTTTTTTTHLHQSRTESPNKGNHLNRSRIAICLVGGARRFELTGPSLIQNVLNVYPNSDLFLHSPLDSNSFKFSLLKHAPKITTIRLFNPHPIPETLQQSRVLTSNGSPNGLQGLLQYFNLVEGCLDMIKERQSKKGFHYDWIVRTRVDGFWSAPLSPSNFVAGKYLVPPGSQYGGLNDRLGIGDLKTSEAALSRLSLIPRLDVTGFQRLNSESAFKAQLVLEGVQVVQNRVPFCIMSDRKYEFPPARFGVPVASISSEGPLSGAKCRPCTPICRGPCVADVVGILDRGWSWIEWSNGSLELCDAQHEWENGWEKIFDRIAGKKLARARKRVGSLKLVDCVADFESMRNRTTGKWEAPSPSEICSGGLGLKETV